MKKSLLYIALMMASVAGFSSCDGDLERPPMIEPEASIKPNTKIADVKAMVWQTDRNYVTTVEQQNNKDVIIAGRVVSSDAAGNVFKNVILEDETGALTFAINAYDLYETYQQGQEIVVNLTGLKIGGYNGLLQVGAEGTYDGKPSMTFMDKDLMASHAEQNGLAHLELIDTTLTTIPELITAKGTVEGLQKWQSRLIRLDGVSFENAGQQFAEKDKNTDRYIKDEQGNRINVRNSGKSKFYEAILPSGKGTVVGILSYYGTDWQILLNNLDGCIGFGDIVVPDDPNNPDNPDNPDTPSDKGTQDKPYSVTDVLNGASGSNVWTKGFIVGWVEGQAYATGAHFDKEATTKTNILLAATADETDVNKCIPIQLPNNEVRTKLNLQDNPGNYGKEVNLLGNLIAYFNVPGVKEVSAFVIEGGASVLPPDPSEAKSYKLATSITSGKSYVIVAEGKVARPVAGNYGYLNVSDVTITDNTVKTDPANEFVFTATDGGYSIKQSDGRYLIMTGTFNSFNMSNDVTEEGVFTVTAGTGTTMLITNVGTGKTLQYSTEYKSYGAYDSVKGSYPSLYERVD